MAVQQAMSVHGARMAVDHLALGDDVVLAVQGVLAVLVELDV